MVPSFKGRWWNFQCQLYFLMIKRLFLSSDLDICDRQTALSFPQINGKVLLTQSQFSQLSFWLSFWKSPVCDWHYIMRLFYLQDEGHSEWVSCVRFSPNSSNPIIVSCGWDKMVKVCFLFLNYPCIQTKARLCRQILWKNLHLRS